MRVPPFERYRRLSASLGIFMLGALIGAALFSGIYAAKFEALVNQNVELEEQLGLYEQEIRKLTHYKNRHSVIQSVVLHIEKSRSDSGREPPLDAVTEALLKKQLKDDLSVFEGRSIYDIDSEARLARLLLDRKVYRGKDEIEYVVEIRTMLVVDNTLRVWVSAIPRSPS